MGRKDLNRLHTGKMLIPFCAFSAGPARLEVTNLAFIFPEELEGFVPHFLTPSSVLKTDVTLACACDLHISFWKLPGTSLSLVSRIFMVMCHAVVYFQALEALLSSGSAGPSPLGKFDLGFLSVIIPPHPFLLSFRHMADVLVWHSSFLGLCCCAFVVC